MHDHLQSLKVTELRAILSKANVRAPGRKNEMIAKIQEDPDALKIYLSLYPAEQPPPEPQPQPQQQPKPVQDEAEKRRVRAERFGIPLVPTALNDPSKLAARAARFGGPASSDANEEEERRRRRAERFATNASTA